LKRLNGNVDTVLDKGECSRDELMRKVSSLITSWSVPMRSSGLPPGKIALQNAKAMSHV
jgi:hypothetical protein